MPKNRKFNQKRTLDFEITTVVSVDIDSLRIRLRSMDSDKIEEKVGQAWAEIIKASLDEPGDENLFLTAVTSIFPSLIRCRQIPNSLRITSIEAFDIEDGEDDS